MKKLLSLMLVLAMTFSLGACSSPTEEPAETEQGTQTEQPKDRAEADIDWLYITADEVKTDIESDSDGYIYFDIQPAEDFAKGHIQDAISVPAYPVDTPELEKLIVDAVSQMEGDKPVVVVCPGGGGGAKRTISILMEQGIAGERLLILEKGAKGWPYPELLVTE